jgi:hypothetical protein
MISVSITGEGKARMNAILKKVMAFLEDSEPVSWADDCTMLKTEDGRCKIVWDDGVTAYARADSGEGISQR